MANYQYANVALAGHNMKIRLRIQKLQQNRIGIHPILILITTNKIPPHRIDFHCRKTECRTQKFNEMNAILKTESEPEPKATVNIHNKMHRVHVYRN